MKHLPADAQATLEAWLRSQSLELPPAVAEAAIRHLEWLIETNTTLNLTAVVDPVEALRLHCLDSLLALPEVETAADGLMVDLGTGGGYPGLPLALATRRTTVLMDSVQKKVAAIQRYLVHESLDSWISVSGERSESIARTTPGTASVVVARAVAALPSLVELAAPLLNDRGVLVALKGAPEASELDRGIRVADMCGLELRGNRSYTLPVGGEARSVLVFERVAPSAVPLPRREGMATKRPLA